MRAELARDFLPLGFIPGDVLDVQRVEHQAGRFQPAVMTGDAIGAKDFTGGLCRRSRFAGERRVLAGGVEIESDRHHEGGGTDRDDSRGRQR